jgi:outer membrane lipoprotein-sorting protein
VYTASNKQVLKNPVPPSFAQHPLINLIHTMENLDRDFIVSQGITRSADEYSLTLTLKTPQGDIQGAHLTVGKKDFTIHELLLRYCSGNYTQFTLSETEENPSIPAARFQFTPPPGVEVIENPAATAHSR